MHWQEEMRVSYGFGVSLYKVVVMHSGDSNFDTMYLSRLGLVAARRENSLQCFVLYNHQSLLC
jgi:hypothetical protein